VLVAATSGLAQTILPRRCRLYHQPHERGLHATFPETDWRVWYERYLEASRHGRRMIVNDENWGLGREGSGNGWRDHGMRSRSACRCREMTRNGRALTGETARPRGVSTDGGAV
jgi:hypothetical protein